MSDRSTALVDVTPGEARIRKSCQNLAKRLIKEDGTCSVKLVVALLKRETDQHMSSQEQSRHIYAFLLKNGVEETVAWDVAGMGKSS